MLNQQHIAYIIKNNKAEKIDVTVGSEIDGYIVIESGIEKGDTLVIVGQDYLVDGDKVNITDLVEGK